MYPKIALVGVPAEIVPIQDCLYSISANLTGVTNPARELILKKAEERGIPIHDLGEVSAGEHYKPKFNIDRLKGVPYFLSYDVPSVKMKALLKSRKCVLEKSKEFDLTVAVGPSHLGAIVLYEEEDVVARLDYHADFTGKDNVVFSYASYMDWIRQNMKKVDVTNFFVKYKEKGFVFGRESSNMTVSSGTNHFDIDVDCFDPNFQIQRVYSHDKGWSGVTPGHVLSMIRQARPRKLGIWEYRPFYDCQLKGLEFVVNAIEAATGKS